MDLKLDKPIFVVYCNINGATRAKSESLLQKINLYFDPYREEAIFWIIGSDKNEIQLIWRGNELEKSGGGQIKSRIKAMNDMCNALEDGIDNEDVTRILRELKISDLGITD